MTVAVRISAPWKRFERTKSGEVYLYELLNVGVSPQVWLTFEAYVHKDHGTADTYWFYHDGGLFNHTKIFPQHEVELELSPYHGPLEAVIGAIAITEAAEQAAFVVEDLFWDWCQSRSLHPYRFRARRKLKRQARALCRSLMEKTAP